MLIVKVLFQLVVNGAILFMFLSHPSIRRLGRNYPLTRLYFYAFFGISLLAQCFTFNQYQWPKEREWFPFTRWAMFAGNTRSTNTVKVYEWQGVQADGTFVEVNPAKLYLTTNACGHFTKTKAMGNLLLIPGFNISEIDMYAKGLFDAYNANVDGPNLIGLNLWCREIGLIYGQEVPEPFSYDSSQIVYKYTRVL